MNLLQKAFKIKSMHCSHIARALDWKPNGAEFKTELVNMNASVYTLGKKAAKLKKTFLFCFFKVLLLCCKFIY